MKQRLSWGILAAVVVVLAAVVVGFARQPKTRVAGEVQGKVSLPVERAAPELVGGEWAQGKPTTIASSRGKVVVLAFWTFACINCKRTQPYWNGWAKKYAGTDVTVLSVHTPELDFERDRTRLKKELQDKGIMFPVLTDNDHRNWDAYSVDAWPTTILIDKQGRIRARYVGELNWNNSGTFRQVDQAIETLRKEG